MIVLLMLENLAPTTPTDVLVLAGTVFVAYYVMSSALQRPNKAPPPQLESDFITEMSPRVTKRDGVCPPVLSLTGVAATQPSTVMEEFRATKDLHANETAFSFESTKEPGKWIDVSWSKYWEDVHAFAASLVALGLQPHGCVTISGFNSPEWFIANFGTIAARGIAAGVYTTNTCGACAYITKDSAATVVVVDGRKQLEKYIMLRDDPEGEFGDAMATVKAIVVWNMTDEELTRDFSNKKGGWFAAAERCPVYSWDQFLQVGRDHENVAAEKGEGEDVESLAQVLQERQAAVQPGECALMIYTSGTTGNPKGVMLSHDNIIFIASSVLHCNKWVGADSRVERIVSYLPLSHVAGNLIDMMMAVCIAGVGKRSGRVHVFFARPDALKGSLPSTLKHVKPTIFLGVPRVWEKIQEGITAKGRANKGIKKMLISFCKDIGTRFAREQNVGGSGVVPFGLAFAEGVVFKKVKEALGLQHCRHGFTGAAPISQKTQEFFGALGVQINEAYGMSESCGATTWSHNKAFKWGKVGWALPGTELKIVHEEGRDQPGEGEVCFRGRHIMMGYLNQPAKTAAAVDKDGWLHSGDVGRIDEDGFLSITGRIKELIITAGGENIAPTPIEDCIKQNAPALSNVMLIGDKRKFNSVLVTLRCDPDGEGGFKPTLTGLAKEVDPDCATVADAQQSALWQDYITEAISSYNYGKTCVSRAQKVQKFRILDSDFSVPSGTLTATLKLKRKVVTEKYAGVIDSMY